MPDGELSWDDLVRGKVTFQTEHVPDFAVARANGQPLYTLVNPVDDAMMHITHVLRGEDLLSSTPRQLALYDALVDLGIATGTPRFGHLPYVMGEGNKKLSKRDPQGNLLNYRVDGFLPEGLLNYLALLGWAISGDRDIFSIEEMVAAFEIGDVNPNPARFDIKKAEAINAAHMRLLSVDEIGRRSVPYLAGAGLVADPPTAEQQALLDAAMPLVAERINKLTESVEMLGFLFVDEAAFARVDDIDDAGREVVRAAHDALAALPEWTTAAIEEALRTALVDGLGLKPRNAFGPVRIAVTGRKVSPPAVRVARAAGARAQPRTALLGPRLTGRPTMTQPVTRPAYERSPGPAVPPDPARRPARMVALPARCRGARGRHDRDGAGGAAPAVRAVVPGRRPAARRQHGAPARPRRPDATGPRLPQPLARRGDPRSPGSSSAWCTGCGPAGWRR